jgi:hypothetical protein
MDLAQIAQVLLGSRGVQLALLNKAVRHHGDFERGWVANKARRSVS